MTKYRTRTSANYGQTYTEQDFCCFSFSNLGVSESSQWIASRDVKFYSIRQPGSFVGRPTLGMETEDRRGAISDWGQFWVCGAMNVVTMLYDSSKGHGIYIYGIHIATAKI